MLKNYITFFVVDDNVSANATIFSTYGAILDNASISSLSYLMLPPNYSTL